MNKVLVAAISLLALGACSKGNVIEQPEPVAISFNNPFVDNSTKATDLTKDNLADFGVWGYVNALNGQVFTNEKVSKSAEGVWQYAQTQYWVPGMTFHFTAIAPAKLSGNYKATEVDGGELSFTNDGETDLLYAYQHRSTGASITEEQPPVEFTFGHMLSRIKFQFTNGMVADNAKITITDVQITDAYKSGTATFTSGEFSLWTMDGTENRTLTIGFGGAGEIGKNSSGETEHKYIIPATGSFNLKFTATLHQGTVKVGEKEHSVILPEIIYGAGKSYLLKATLTADNVIDNLYPIKFSVGEFDGWESFTGSDITINN